MVDIIMLTHNHLDDTKKCVESIDVPHRLIVVDDKSTDGTREFFKGPDLIKSDFPDFNLSKSINAGLRIHRSGLILIINNDILFAKGAIAEMVKTINNDTETGMVGPLTNVGGSMNPLQIMSQTAERADARTFRTLPLFCNLIRKELIGKVGFLDEDFSGYGCEDDDWCIRIMRAGYKLMVCGRAYIHHNATLTYKERDKKRLFRESIKVFKEKYNVPPAQDWKELGIV